MDKLTPQITSVRFVGSETMSIGQSSKIFLFANPQLEQFTEQYFIGARVGLSPDDDERGGASVVPPIVSSQIVMSSTTILEDENLEILSISDSKTYLCPKPVKVADDPAAYVQWQLAVPTPIEFAMRYRVDLLFTRDDQTLNTLIQSMYLNYMR